MWNRALFLIIDPWPDPGAWIANIKDNALVSDIMNQIWKDSDISSYRNTVDSRYLEVEGTLWNTSRCP